MTGFDVLISTLKKRNRKVLDGFVWLRQLLNLVSKKMYTPQNKGQSFRIGKAIIGISRSAVGTYKSCIWCVALYGSETRTLGGKEERVVTAFET
jgi:hypothetical protein